MTIPRLLKEIENRKSEIIQLTSELIKIPTVNPPGKNYREICEYLSNRLKRSGFDVNILRAEGALADSDKYPRYNLIARHEGTYSGQCIHFNSHIDVVNAGNGWTRDPFGGTIEGDMIFGRGSCDMKGGLASSIVAAEAFIAIFPNYYGAIEISATADEETGGYGGVAWLAEKGLFSPKKVQHVIIPEPLNKDRICLGHRGVWWTEIETKGRVAHGSMPFLGDCAIRHMGAVLEEIENNLLPKLNTKKTKMPVVPEKAKKSTLNINSIHGGLEEVNETYNGLPAPLVSDSCRMILDRRYLVEETLNEVKLEIYEILEKVKKNRTSLEYSVKDLFEVKPSFTDPKSKIVQTVEDSIAEILGVKPKHVVSPGSYDQKHIDRIGKLKNCIAYGPGILELAHQPDEFILISDMMDSAKIMAMTISKLLNKNIIN
jgi:succinyl-diaminopimelate desuccinylase